MSIARTSSSPQESRQFISEFLCFFDFFDFPQPKVAFDPQAPKKSKSDADFGVAESGEQESSPPHFSVFRPQSPQQALFK